MDYVILNLEVISCATLYIVHVVTDVLSKES